ncbi:MC079 [Molluscum contagiosum virus subtype 2]|uniref:DNA-directed RNA polymerase 147 kDa polypeptide n=3 Tax=Molluscum contagiosum virus TaxID=10279 RepID=A0A1S7DLR7_MCV2|nr:MC079 [Molluscum contagiosum virus subtype 2]QHW16467.1 MC079R [Molluscum contagiosum virus]AYO87714.1 MC079 [Molluscum contagiosum virus subtype 2]AYO87884.1 MC079 [Molluscum contagiosum virus subtype 2]AYO88054.1 MC079 [Molluscum contagiosum virus subtype 2]
MAVIARVSYSLYTQNEINANDILINHVKNDDDVGTVKDSRLGAMDGVLCRTCGRTELECFGHWGKVRLYETHIVKPEYIHEVIRIFNHICSRCGLLRSREPYTVPELGTLSAHALKKLKDKISSKKKSCWNNKCMQPYQKIAFSKKKVCFVNKIDDVAIPNALLYQKITSIHRSFWPLLEIFQDPANLFYKGYFPIPPLIIRPAISFWIDSIPKETNELTYLLGMIVKYSNMNAEEQVLQKAVIEYDNIKIIVNNNTSSINLSYITSGKNNMIRSYMVARRKDQTARSVLGPDPELSITEVGIPDYVRNTLTEKVFVNAFTAPAVEELFRRNEVKFYFNKRLGQLTRIKPNKFVKNKIHLLPGDWVETRVREFTSIIFGRQPSLHKYNVISSSVRATSGDTIKIPPGIANSQNADFDGDEEWMILEQNPKSVLEQSILMYPATLLKHDVHGMPVYGAIQDEILAAYALFRERDLSLAAVRNILGKYGAGFAGAPGARFSGRDVFRFLVGQDIYYPGILEAGEIVAEDIDSSFVVAMKHRSLAGLIADYRSSLEGIAFIDRSSYVFKRYLRIYGFGVTFRNLCPDFRFVNRLHALNVEKINLVKAAYRQYLADVASGTVLPLSPGDEAEAVDAMLSGLTNMNVREIEAYMRRTLREDPDNSLLRMSCAGYKVNPTELMYILGTYGQQRVDGEAVEPRVLGRVLPYFPPDSRDPEGRGYILNSLMQGLTGSQYYFAMLIARSQSTDIVCETSRTGTLARKIIKKMEDMVVNGYGQVVYGNTLIKYAANYAKVLGSVCKPVELIYPHEGLEWFLEISAIWERIKHGFIYSQRQKLARVILAPFNFQVFVRPAAPRDAMPSKALYDLIQAVVEDVRENYFFGVSDIDFIEYVFLTHLNPARVRISRATATLIFAKLYEKLNYTLGGGLPIGIISAQVLSEKFTQQALSSFHTTEKSGGVKRKLGFNEFNNLTNLSKNKTEIVTLISDDARRLQTVKINFEFVCLGELMPRISVRRAEGSPHHTIDILVNRLYVKRHALTELVVEHMIEKFVAFSVLVKDWGLETTVEDAYNIRFTVLASFVEPQELNKNKFMLMLPGAANKGKISKYKIPISEYQAYDDFHSTRRMFRMTVELMSLKELGIFNLLGVNVIPGIWNTYEIFGIEAAKSFLCEALLGTYGEGLDYLYQPCDLLASLLCMNYEPESINKFKFGAASALKRATFGDNKALINAALHKRTEPVADNSSCHFFSKVPRIGTGYYRYFVNLELLLRMEKTLTEQVVEKKVEDIATHVEDF